MLRAGCRSFYASSRTQSKRTRCTKYTRAFSVTRVTKDVFNPTTDHEQLRETVRSFVDDKVRPQALENDKTETFNVDLFRELGKLELLGLTAQEEYGGSAMDASAVALVHEELSAADPGFCLAYLAHSLLFVHNLAVNGNEEQKKKYLPKACTGEYIGGMCMSEPAVGTDVLGMKTKAVKGEDGSYVLNGTKMWITNGSVDGKNTGDVFLVYARTGEGPRDFSLFLVEKDDEGFSLGQKLKDKLGMRASTTAELVFDNVKIPADRLVGTEGGAVACMMRNLAVERVGLAAMSLGIARESVEVMNKYSRDRTSFGKPLNRYGQIQRHIADSYAEYMAGRCYTYQVAERLDLFSPPKQSDRVDSDGVKLFCSTMGKNVADRAIQTLGGYGYVGEYNVERLWRDAKLLEIGGGTLEAHQKNMTGDLSKLVTDKLDELYVK